MNMSESLVELMISEVLDAVPLRPGQEAGLAVLAELSEPFRALHIYIGQVEAKAIQAGRRGDRPPRPSTWDLFLSALELCEGRLDRVVIDRVEESRHFFANLEILRGDDAHMLPCRPSDALALVVRVPQAVLYATEEVMIAAGRYPDLPEFGVPGSDFLDAEQPGPYAGYTELQDTELQDTELLEADQPGTDTYAGYTDLEDTALLDAEGPDTYTGYTDLRDTDLPDAEPEETDAGYTELRDTDLLEAELRDTDLLDADLLDAELPGPGVAVADLPGADLWDPDLPGGERLGDGLPGADVHDPEVSGPSGN